MLKKYDKKFKEKFYKILEKSGFNLIIEDDFNKTYVYEKNESIVGFINYSLIYDRAELNYIYVDDKYRRQNIAKEMMEFLINEVTSMNYQNITLEVRNSNINAIKLYKLFNFEEAAIRKNYYNGEDAILMIRKFDINESSIYIRN